MMRDYKIDERPKRHGWAPGQYMGRCMHCEASISAAKGAVSCADCAYKDWAPTHRHGKTGGLYRLVPGYVQIEATNTTAVCYEAQDGTIWVRPATEFHDGRFATLEP